ncbi:hypothetical protein [Clostridium sp. JN-1]|uniref:hypothetical protein n=1 Tax=Clostridium sp. JN-1 TaxID=2483110 RepID=UPI000F0B8A0A|nr:hypothetical protein [Clostridium sp. JN-1]
MDKKGLINIIGKSDEKDWDYNRDEEIYIFNLNKNVTIELDMDYKESLCGLWTHAFEKTDAEKVRFFLCFK